MNHWIARATAGLSAVAFVIGVAGAAYAQSAQQGAPKRGGTLTVSATSGIPTLDCTSLGYAGGIVYLGPGYSTLLRFDEDVKIVGDVAASWTASPDRLTYTFKLKPGIKFHDGSTLTSADVAASLERVRNPPQGVVSLRQQLLKTVTAFETPDPLTLVARLSRPDPIILLSLANPNFCIYSAAMLAKDPKYPEKTVMGTGPFKLVDYNPSSNLSYVRFDDYFNKPAPYLDGLKFIMPTGSAALINAVSGGQVDAVMCCMAPQAINQIKASRGDRTVFEVKQVNVTNFFTVNTRKAPFDDVRVRQALQLSIDRPQMGQMLKTASNGGGVASLFPGGAPMDFTDEELAQLPGWGADIAASRAKAKALLADAGQSNLAFTIIIRNTGEPFTTMGIVGLDAFKQIGLNVTQRSLDTATYLTTLSGGNFDVIADVNVTTSQDPSEVLSRYLPNDPQNYSGSKDTELQKLYDQQAVETDDKKRRDLVEQFERRVFDQAYYLPLSRSLNVAPLPAELRGWKMLPSQTLNMDFRGVWLDK